MGVIVGVDGGNTKTDLLAATIEGEPVAYVRGGGSNSHGPGGAEATARTIAALAQRALESPADYGAFFLCGADVPSDIEALDAAIGRSWVRDVTVDNDTFALLRAGTDHGDAVAVVCGGGFNSVGRAADGRSVRYPSLGWQTGDWGGSEMLGREVMFHAARAEDGRGERTALVQIVRRHFGLDTVAEIGEAVYYRRIPEQRLGELAPAVVAAAAAGDAVAGALVERLAEEVALAAWRALRDLDLLGRPADVVLGGGMLSTDNSLLDDAIAMRLGERAPQARIVVSFLAPVLGSALAALDAVGASPEAAQRLREAFTRLTPEDLG